MTPREFQSLRDGLVLDGLIFEKSVNLVDTLVEMDMVYPFNDSEVSMDSIGGDNHKQTWIAMNKLAKKLSSKLSDQVHADDNVFSMHQGFKVVGQGKGEAVKYLPFTLELDDGQVLTALAKNVKEFKQLKPNQDLIVTHFMLNKKDITHAIYKNGDTNIDVAQTVARLKTVIEATHRKFVSKNPMPDNSREEADALRSEIQSIEIDFSNVVEDAPVKQTREEWEGEIVRGLEESLEVNTSDAQGIIQAQDFLLMQSWTKGETPSEVVAKIAEQGKDEPAKELSENEKLANAIYAFKSGEGRLWKSKLKEAFENHQYGHKHEEYKDALARFRNRENTFNIMNLIKQKDTAKDILDLIGRFEFDEAEKAEESKKALSADTKVFVEKYFGETINTTGKTLLRRFLADESMENPDIPSPTVFKAGLEKAGVLADDDTFMTGFKNLRDLFYGRLSKKEPSPEVEKEVEPAVEEQPKAVSIKAKLKTIKPFMNKMQYKIITTDMDKEDYEFNDIIDRLYETITNMPKTYEQDGKGDDAVAHLHYFNSGSDWYITEKDMGNEQVQAFGYARLNGDTQNAEMGYISIEELVKRGVELDFHYTPETLGKIKGKDSEVETKNEMPPFKHEEDGKEFTNITEEDMEAFKEELENFITDDFVSTAEFAEAYKSELSQYTDIDLDKEGLEYAEQAQAIEEAQRALFGSSINDKDEMSLESLKKEAEAKGLDVVKEGAEYAVLKVENIVLSVHLARFTTLEEVSKFLQEYDVKFYSNGRYNMAQHESEQYSEEVDRSLLIDATTADEFEAKLDELVENLEKLGQLEEYEDELNALADKLTEMMKSENA